MSGVLVITGGSRGIGAATARRAAQKGWAVCVNYNASKDAAQKVVSDIVADGGQAVAVGADVSTPDGAAHLFQSAENELGKITALFNNAGNIHRNTLMGDFSAEVLEDMWRVNISSQFLCAGEAVKRMAKSHGGTGGAIVNMSSAAARIGGGGGLLAYAASKGAIDTLTLGMAHELGPQGIRVNAVRPGLIETTIHDDTGDLQRLEKLVGGVPLGRTGTAEEIADGVLYLLSDDAQYVSGALLDIGGGR